MPGPFIYDGSWEHFNLIKDALATGEQRVEPWMYGRFDESFEEVVERFNADGMQPPIAVRITRPDGTVNFLNPGSTVSIDGT